MQAMNTPDTPASAADLDAVRLSAQTRKTETLKDAESLEAIADFLRESKIRLHISMAEVIERSAANLRQLVE